MSEGNGYAGREALLAQNQVRYRDVPIPELGLKFRIRSLSELEKSSYETATGRARNEAERRALVRDFRRRLAVLCLVDGRGNRLLSDEDVSALGPIDGLALGRIVDAAWDHCGFSRDESIEDLVKNSAAIHAACASSDSPAT